jgi:transcriptional regulator with XRE-family HTH domain
MPSPTVRRLQLGHEVRRLREAAGHTPAQAARVIQCGVAKISKLEHGQTGITVGDLTLLLQSFGAEPAEVERLVALSRGNRERLRWTGHREGYPEWFRTYVDFERDAEDIRWNEVEIVPGLLQTEAYAQAIYLSGEWAEDADGAAAAGERLRERLQVHHRGQPPTLSIILSESCVRRVVGDRAVMAEQLDHLARMADERHVQIQLRPFDMPFESGSSFRFTLLRIPVTGSAPSLEFVYLDSLTAARFFDDEPTVRAYDRLWGRLQAAALSPAVTRTRLRAIAREYRKGSPDAGPSTGPHRSPVVHQ